MTSKIINFKALKNNNVQNPWGNQGQQGSKGNSGEQKPQNPNPGQPRPQNNRPGNPNDDVFDKFEKYIEGLFGKGSGNGGNNNKSKNPNPKAPKSIIGLSFLALILLWLSTGIYKVNSDENAVVLYFGKFYSIENPGLHYHIPFPFGKVIKESVTIVNTEEFGFSTSSATSRNLEAESLMLTGDENIVDVEFQVQWQIADVKNYIFNIADPRNAIRKTAESAMREVIANTPIANALSDGKRQIELETKESLQKILDYYGAGVRITLVQMRRVDPPSKVIDAFRDVQTAKADKEREINQAQAYSNDIIPRARGKAAQMEQESEAYKQEVVANAQGEAGRFISVYRQYARAKRVTKKRMYLETMERIYKDMDKVIIGKDASRSGVIPYFPLNDMPKSK